MRATFSESLVGEGGDPGNRETGSGWFRLARHRLPLRSWKAFGRTVRIRPEPLLARLPDFADSVLVAGCQRSGTTALTRVIAAADGFTRFAYTHDDELDAAQILAGVIACPRQGRRCFQTTYLNDRVSEYWTTPGDFRLIWVLREPVAVVRSMVHNWRRFALNELFLACGIALATERERALVRRFGPWTISPTRRASLAYVGKTSQVVQIAARLPRDRLRVVDYNDLIGNRDPVLAKLFDFIGEPYRASYGVGLHASSLGLIHRLPARTKANIEAACSPAYRAAAQAARDRLVTAQPGPA